MLRLVGFTSALVLASALVACDPVPPRPTTPVAPAPDPALATRIDAAIDRMIADQHVVGVVVLVARDGELFYHRAAGFADREARRPMREDTVFRLASMTKPIVSAAAMALVDQGKLSLADPVTKWLPDFRPKLADGSEPALTVRHLITHTSGLTYKFLEAAGGPYHAAEVSDGLGEPGLAADVNLRRLASVPLLFAPGTSWQYGLSIDVLGEVVARAGGASLPALVKHLVTAPLKMTDTTFVVIDRDRIAWPYGEGKPPARMTEPYDVKMGDAGSVRFSPVRIFDSGSFPSGGAGMAGTAADYMKFLEAIRKGGAPILRADSARAMVENQIGELNAPFLNAGNRFGFGFGVTVDPKAAGRPAGTGTFSWGGIYGTTFWVDPGAKLTVVIFTNVAGDTPLVGDIEKAIYAR
jgi:CubicO group peptidase (beta-lactamase class C family)